MSLETGRKLGLISSILLVILPIIGIITFAGFFLTILSAVQLSTGAVPSVSSILGASIGLGISAVVIGVLFLAAVVLFIVAMYYLSHYYNDRVIFTNVIYAVILYIATVVTTVVLQYAILVPALSSLTPSTSPSNIFSSGFFILVIALAIVSIVILIIIGVLIWRALNRLGEKSEIDNFKTAGLLFLIGVLLLIIAIGIIVIWIAFILAAVGFYRLKPIQTYVPETAPPPPVTIQTKRCPNCGTENTLDAANCRFCGKPLQ